MIVAKPYREVRRLSVLATARKTFNYNIHIAFNFNVRIAFAAFNCSVRIVS